jgi:hypothetical protein
MFVENEEMSRVNVTSSVLLVSAALIFSGGLLLPWFSLEVGPFERLTWNVGAGYRIPTITLGVLTFVLGLLLRSELGPRLWRLPLSATVAGSSLAVAFFDVTLAMSHLNDDFLGRAGRVTAARIGIGVWVIVIGAVLQGGVGLLSWGLERAPERDRTVRA